MIAFDCFKYLRLPPSGVHGFGADDPDPLLHPDPQRGHGRNEPPEEETDVVGVGAGAGPESKVIEQSPVSGNFIVGAQIFLGPLHSY